MIVQIVSRIGGEPLQIEASQLLVLNEAGTPVMVAGLFGPEGAIRAAHAGDEDFNQVLRAFGHGRHHVLVETIEPRVPEIGRSGLRPAVF